MGGSLAVGPPARRFSRAGLRSLLPGARTPCDRGATRDKSWIFGCRTAAGAPYPGWERSRMRGVAAPGFLAHPAIGSRRVSLGLARRTMCEIDASMLRSNASCSQPTQNCSSAIVSDTKRQSLTCFNQALTDAHGAHAASPLPSRPIQRIFIRNSDNKFRENASGLRIERRPEVTAYLHSALSAHDPAPHAPKHGFFWYFMRALTASRQKQADREIALYLARSGGKFTDESEREIERRMIARSAPVVL